MGIIVRYLLMLAAASFLAVAAALPSQYSDILHRCRVRRARLQLTVAVYRGATATGRGVKVAVIGTGSLDLPSTVIIQ
ncbi:unnamed protein product [Sphagnum balticum]